MNLNSDDFTLFALPQQYSLDINALNIQWKKALASTHPDRFAQTNAAEQRLAMQWSMRLNEAYQRLKNPLKRAEYLCGLRNSPVNSEQNTAMPAEFLMQQMRWHEALDEARTDTDKARIHEELLLQVQQYQHGIQYALDCDNDANTATALVRAWLFIDKLLKQT